MVEISFVVATFNAASTLERCLQSICSQLTDECELIIVDGLSKDGTCEIIRAYSPFIANFFSESDEGIYDAWNKGIKVARGNWIGFIGADDVLLPNAVQTYLEVIHRTSDISTYDYICAHNEFVNKKGRLLKIVGLEPCWSGMRCAMMPAHVASLHNMRNLFMTMGLYNLTFKICADYELLLRKKNNLKYLFLPNHIARMQAGGMSFTTQAIVETYRIRKFHHTVSEVMNVLLFLRDWVGFKWFVLRKSF